MKLRHIQGPDGLTITAMGLGFEWDEPDAEKAARLIGLGVAEVVESGPKPPPPVSEEMPGQEQPPPPDEG